MIGPFSPDSVGVVINVLALAVAYISMRAGQKKDQLEADERINKRHQENQELMTLIRIQLEGLKHLDPRMNDLKAELTNLQDRLHKVEGSVLNREQDILRALEHMEKRMDLQQSREMQAR